MDVAFYIIVFDAAPFGSMKRFHQKFKRIEGVLAWWKYLKLSYIIKVPDDIFANDITKAISDIAPRAVFFVAEIDINETNGRLRPEAWDWLREQRQLLN